MIRIIAKFVCLLFFISIPPIVFAKHQLYYFEPNHVKLNGMIKILKFPGAPNYESVKDGDTDETGPYLILESPIDIELVPKVQIGNDAPQKNVKLIQIVVQNDDWKKIKEGSKVQIEGTLFSALTGHHHARVLVAMNKIAIISDQKIQNKNLNITEEDWQFLKYQHLQNDDD